MQNAVPDGKGAMAAVLGLDAEKIEAAIAGIEGVSIANYNCPGQIVITGWKESVEQAGAVLKLSLIHIFCIPDFIRPYLLS